MKDPRERDRLRLAIDVADHFARGAVPSTSGGEVERVATNPTILVASDWPIAVGPDGNLYLPRGGGAVEIQQVTPTGQRRGVATLPAGFVTLNQARVLGIPAPALYVVVIAAILWCALEFLPVVDMLPTCLPLRCTDTRTLRRKQPTAGVSIRVCTTPR